METPRVRAERECGEREIAQERESQRLREE